MTSLPARVRRVTGFLFTDPSIITFLTVAYVVAGIGFVLTDYTLNNEGTLTYYWSSWARHDFVPVFFFQRIKPVLCSLYAPVTAAGLQTTLVVHVLVAATAIPMLATIARSIDYRLPNVPALVVALSPVYFFGGAAGFSNVDGVVGIVLALYLLCARGLPLAAGLVLGVLPWVRYELVTFAAVMGLYALVTKGQRALLFGLLVFPLFYASTGAVYHRDVLWLLHFSVSVPRDPDNLIYVNQLIGLRYFLEPAAALTPLAVLGLALPLIRLQRVEWAVLTYAVLNLALMNVLPILGVGNFGNSPRYLLHVLPALALLVGRVLGAWWEAERPRSALLVATALLAVWVATRQQDAYAVAILLVAYTLILAAVWFRAWAIGLAFATVLAFVGPLLPLRTEVLRSTTAKYLDGMVAWLEAHPALKAQPIYTNSQLLASALERHQPGASVYHLAGMDMIRDLTLLTNPENGQRDRIWRLCALDLYGKTLLPPFRPEDIPDNAVFALREDVRLPMLMPAVMASPRFTWLVRTPDYGIAQFLPEAAAEVMSLRSTRRERVCRIEDRSRSESPCSLGRFLVFATGSLCASPPRSPPSVAPG